MRPSADQDHDRGENGSSPRAPSLARLAIRPSHYGETTNGAHGALDPELSLARYETYWTHTAECLYIVQVMSDGSFVYEGLNPAHERLTGLTNAQVAGRTPHECLPADIADHLCARYRECVAAGAPIQYEHELDLPGGRRRWSSTLAPMRDPGSGRIMLLLAGCRDITREHESGAEAERTRKAMAASRERTRAILAGVRDGFLGLDEDFVVTEVNHTVVQWLGLRREDVLGHNYAECFPDAPLARPEVRQRLLRDGAFHIEFESRIRRGRWLDMQAYRVADGYSVFVRDVTRRRRSRRALERSKGLLDATLNAMPSHVAIIEPGGRIVRVNASWRAALRTLGMQVPHDGVGTCYLEIAALAGLDARDQRRLRGALTALLRGASETFRRTVRTTSGGSPRWYQVNGARFELDGAPRIVLSHEDVTAIQEAQATINSLSQRLLNLQEEERQRIAVELHDSTAQQLTAIGLYMIPLRHALGDDEASARALSDAERTLDEAQKEIRNFSYLLHPPYLDRDGLKLTLVRFIEGYATRTGLRAEAQIPDLIDSFSPDVQRALLRVVQEALSNIHRHAAAREVQVRMKATGRMFILSVSDDGRGLNGAPGSEPRRAPGLGLPGMHARVHQFGGAMQILTGAQGTTVHAKIPLVRCRA
jgi:PAS domain S-box-containing protein